MSLGWLGSFRGGRQDPIRSQELIFLDADDDLGTVRAKLESSPADDLFLVVPRRAATLRTPLEYRILARMAHELSTDVTIVSSDAGRRFLARQEGLRTRRGYAGVRHLADAAGAPRPWLPGFLEWLPLPSIAAMVVLALIVGIVGTLMLVALPVMRVTVTPASEAVQRELELFVDPNQRNPDIEKGFLPGEVLQYRFEVAGSVPTTGQKQAGRDPARGEVVFSNATANPIVLPARTVAVARNGSRFLTDAELRVNGFSYGIARIGVTAEQRGIAGNVEANQIVTLDPPIDKLTVANQKPFTGGSERPARAVAAADQVKLKEQLTQRAREQALAEFGSRGGQAKSVPPNTLQLRMETESFQPPVEAEADQLSGAMGFSASAVAWDNQALNTLVQRMLLARFGAGYELPLNQLNLPPPEVLDAQNQRMRVKIKADALVVRSVNTDDIAAELRGKSSGEARSMLQSLPELAGEPRVEIVPPWAPRAYRVEVSRSDPK